jgi:threonine aldolase
MLDLIDLRSDTVTEPTQEMRQAMADALVGDDGYGEDVTVNRLESLTADMLNKESALFVPSGTMGNLVALMAHTHHGDEVILDAKSHIYEYELGGMSAIAGAIPRPVRFERGRLTPEVLRAAIRAPHMLHPPTTLLCLENTHNQAGGTVVTPEQLAEVAVDAREYGLKIHLDGARIFNAAVALGIDVRELTRHVDSVMFCFSKGLSAPVGSALVGGKEFIERARRIRRMLGGGMRQVGVLAAAALVALESMVDRLRDDHKNARLLADGLAAIDDSMVDLDTVQTNIVNCDVSVLRHDADSFIQALQPHGIKVNPRLPNVVRMVTHRQINPAHIHRTLEVMAQIADERG